MVWVGTARARAKINLTLHIIGRREDGYHNLESLVAFANVCDDLRLVEGSRLSLTVSGPEASSLTDEKNNHILKAAMALAEHVPHLRTGAFHLTKRLPIASGMGGGSADAAAALRLLARLNDLTLQHPAILDAARNTGADVPVCLEGTSRIMRGIGDHLDEPVHLPRLFAVLVNPRRGSSTPAVFSKIGLTRGDVGSSSKHPCIVGGLTAPALLSRLAEGRNDMEAAAISLEPEIGAVRDALSALTTCRLVRMSGSGATVFGLFDDCRAAARASKMLKVLNPSWWVRSTTLA